MNQSNKIYTTLFFLLLLACQAATPAAEGPAGYNWASPKKLFMPDILLEVSGITLNPDVDDSIYTQQDEAGRVFMLREGEKTYRDFRFAADGDYEDIARIDSQFFVLRSDGVIYSFPLAGLRARDQNSVQVWKDLLPKGEYEGLFGDPKTGLLWVLCKDCSGSKGDIWLQALRWSGQDLQYSNQSIRLPADAIRTLLAGKSWKGKTLQPSALARHPLTGHWFILSHVNKLLIEADEKGAALNAWPLSPSRFRQPEGICFAPNGDLYISNEGDEVSSGNILLFSYQLQPKQP